MHDKSGQTWNGCFSPLKRWHIYANRIINLLKNRKWECLKQPYLVFALEGIKNHIKQKLRTLAKYLMISYISVAN